MSWDENSFLTGIVAGKAMKGASVLGRVPILTAKTVTANGTYYAEDDGADGYSSVTVNLSGGGTGYVLRIYEFERMFLELEKVE